MNIYINVYAREKDQLRCVPHDQTQITEKPKHRTILRNSDCCVHAYETEE